MKKLIISGIIICLIFSMSPVTASDSEEKEDSSDISNLQADLKVTYVKGGFGFSMWIKNFGEEDALYVKWQMSWDGLAIIWDMQDSGRISRIPAGDQVMVRTNKIFGLGPTTIQFSVNASNSETYAGEVDGYLIGKLLGLWEQVYP